MSAEPAIRRGYSTAADPVEAAREFHASVAQPDGGGLVVFFCAASYNLDRLAEALRERFGTAHLIGCTTAGEIGPPGYLEGSIAGFSLPSAGLRAASALISDLARFEMSQGHAAADAALNAVASQPGGAIDPARSFAMVLTDGLATNEEQLVVSIHARMGNIPLLGGSAGDNLNLQQAYVFHDGRFHADTALLTLIEQPLPVRTYRWQHFFGSGTKMVVTAADPATRVVTEINAEPAAEEYARIAGLDLGQLTPLAFAEYPVMVRVGGDWYVRSIARMNPNGSLTFFCAIDEGIVLTLARREDIAANLAQLFDLIRAEIGSPQLVVGFDCVLRRLEAENRQLKHELNNIMAANKVIGFCTYGEQFGAMHVNHTFTAVAFGSAPP